MEEKKVSISDQLWPNISFDFSFNYHRKSIHSSHTGQLETTRVFKSSQKQDKAEKKMFSLFFFLPNNSFIWLTVTCNSARMCCCTSWKHFPTPNLLVKFKNLFILGKSPFFSDQAACMLPPSSVKKIALRFGVGNRGKIRLVVKPLSLLSVIITLIQRGLGVLVTGTMAGASQTE